MIIELPGRISIRYELIEGDGSRPYLVFIHEGLGCVEMWRDFPQSLCNATGCPGLVYDRCGYGKSSPLKQDRELSYVHDYARVELPQLLASVIPEKEHILVGHSDGASIALIYGASGAGQLLGIVSMAAHAFVEEVTLIGIREADSRFDANGPGGLARYHGEKTTRIFKAWSETWLSPWFRGWSIEELLDAVRCPTLVLQGVDDQYGTARQVEAIAEGVSGPAFPHLLADCGHVPHLEQAETVLSVAGTFIEGIVQG